MKLYKANNSKKKISIVAICLLLTVVMVVGGTLAYLFISTEDVKNTFTPAKVGNHIEETLEGAPGPNMVKTNVRVENSIKGATDLEIVNAYTRTKYIVTWQKTAGDVKYALPADISDYNVLFNLDNSTTGDVPGKWVLHTDGYYYFTGIVAPGAATDILIRSIVPYENAASEGYTVEDGYKLNVEIISQSIQAEGTDAAGKTPIELAWKVKISGNTVTSVS